MALIQNNVAKRKVPTTVPYQAGQVQAMQVVADFTTVGANIGDIVEVGVLPAGAVITDAYLDSGAAIADTTWDVGFMSGTPGALLDDDGVSARTCGDELFAAASLATGNTAIVRVTKPDGLFSTPSVKDRSIGLKLAAANVAAGAGKKVNLTVHYTQP